MGGGGGTVEAAAMAGWLEENVSESTRRSAEYAGEVTTAALRRGVPNPTGASTSAPIATLSALMPLLRSAVAGSGAELRDERETSVLFAAQRFCDAAGHPKGLLTRLFRDLYNNDVLDEPAMQRWRADASEANAAGKTKALFEVTEYLVELEAEAEEDEDGDDA